MCEDTVARGGERTLRCPRGHSFDIAKQGYATLLRGRAPHPGDSVAMIEARDAFLAAGHYRFIADALDAASPKGPGFSALAGGSAAGNSTAPRADGLILDAGAGTGWYLARLLDEREATGLALDVSKPALRRAARCHPRAAAVLADVWVRLPVASESADLVVNVFAPRNGAEFHRVLRTGGALVVVSPAPDHLKELIASYGLLTVETDKSDKIAEALPWFDKERSATHERTLTLDEDEVRTLIGMTPSARHVAPKRVEASRVTAAVDVTVFRRRDRPLPSPAADRDAAR